MQTRLGMRPELMNKHFFSEVAFFFHSHAQGPCSPYGHAARNLPPTSLPSLLRVFPRCVLFRPSNTCRSCREHKPEIQLCPARHHPCLCSSTPRALVVHNSGYPDANLRLGATARSKCHWLNRDRGSTAERSSSEGPLLLHIRI